jgi:hypothetical protein
VAGRFWDGGRTLIVLKIGLSMKLIVGSPISFLYRRVMERIRYFGMIIGWKNGCRCWIGFLD